MSPRGSPPRLLDLRRGRGLVIVTGGPPCVSNAPLGGLNGGKGSILQLPRVSSITSRRVRPEQGKPRLETTKNSSPPGPGERQRRLERGGLPPNIQSRCFPLPRHADSISHVSPCDVDREFDSCDFLNLCLLSASNAIAMPCLQCIPVLQPSLSRSHLFLFPS